MAKLSIQITIVNISSNSIGLALALELLRLDELSVGNFLLKVSFHNSTY